MSLDALSAGLQLAQAEMAGAQSQGQHAEDSRKAVADVGARVANNKDSTARAMIDARYEVAMADAEKKYAEKKLQRADTGRIISGITAGASTLFNVGSGVYKSLSGYDQTKTNNIDYDPSDKLNITNMSGNPNGAINITANLNHDGKDEQFSVKIDKSADNNITGISIARKGEAFHPMTADEGKLINEKLLPELNKTNTKNDADLAAGIQGIGAFAADKSNAAKVESTASSVIDSAKKVGASLLIDGIGGSMPQWKAFMASNETYMNAKDEYDKAMRKLAAAQKKLLELQNSLENANANAGG